MATQNAIDTGKPIEVSKGGTGAASFTSNRVLLGNGTGAVAVSNSGTNGYLFVGRGASSPSFGSTADADFTFDGLVAGGTRTLMAQNKSNTANSHARLKTQTAGTSAGDPYISYEVLSGGQFVTGVDNTDSDKFKISSGASIGTNDTLVITSLGAVTKPSQPANLALANAQNNVTGDGTTYTMLFANEIFDQSNNWTGGSTFTASVTGRYKVDVSVELNDIGAAHTQSRGQIISTARTYNFWYCNPGAVVNLSGELSFSFSTLIDMTAADQFTTTILVSNGAKVVDMVAGNCYLSCHLVC